MRNQVEGGEEKQCEARCSSSQSGRLRSKAGRLPGRTRAHPVPTKVQGIKNCSMSRVGGGNGRKRYRMRSRISVDLLFCESHGVKASVHDLRGRHDLRERPERGPDAPLEYQARQSVRESSLHAARKRGAPTSSTTT